MKILDLNELLQAHPYPGRGIVLGRSADGQKAVIAYFIMGRSENSRNRVFETTDDGIRTRAFDECKMTDPSLIIYHPVRRVVGSSTVVTNGDQTDTIRDGLLAGKSYIDALRTRCFEPDGPNYTPRISGVVEKDGSLLPVHPEIRRRGPRLLSPLLLRVRRPPGRAGPLHPHLSGERRPPALLRGEPRQVAITAPDAQTLAESAVGQPERGQQGLPVRALPRPDHRGAGDRHPQQACGAEPAPPPRPLFERRGA